MRTPTQRGGKGRGKLWRQTRQVERYPVVTDAELIAMTYPSEANNVGSTRRSRLQRSREALAFLAETGYANVAADRELGAVIADRVRLGELDDVAIDLKNCGAKLYEEFASLWCH